MDFSQSPAMCGAFGTLAPEIVNMILDEITDQVTMERLGQTCRGFSAIIAPRIHANVVARAYQNTDIARLIVKLEKYLTIAQKRQLRQEAGHAGQQETYPSNVDEHAVPACAAHVRQFRTYVSTRYQTRLDNDSSNLVFRYLEESLRVMTNLELVSILRITSSMARSILKLKNLKALNVQAPRDSQKEARFLAKLQNLEHLSLESTHYQTINWKGEVFPSLLLNSRSTLKSLWINGGYSTETNSIQWIQNLDCGNGGPVLTALDTLRLSFAYRLDLPTVQALGRMTHLLKLKDLCVDPFWFGVANLYRHLTSLVTSTQPNDIKLRGFRTHMSRRNPMTNEVLENQDALYEFLLAFDALTSLRITAHENRTALISPGCDESNLFHLAITNHSNLKSLNLKICVDNGSYDSESRYHLSPATIVYILDRLPNLGFFGFPPQDDDWKNIGEALSHGKSLTEVTCYPFAIYRRTEEEKEVGLNHLLGIIDGLMISSSREMGWKHGRFVWEEVYHLRRVNNHVAEWEIGTKIRDNLEGAGKIEKRINPANGNQEVEYRDITDATLDGQCRQDEIDGYPRKDSDHYGYNWIEWVSKRIGSS